MTSYQSIQTKQTSASGQAHIIQNDAEALEVAKQFAEQFKKKPQLSETLNEFYRIPKSML